MVASDSSYPFSIAPATNGGSSSNTFCIPREIVVLFNQARHPQGLYSAVDTGMTFFSLSSFTWMFLPPSFARPGTSAEAGGDRLNVYDAIRSRVIHSRTFRARQGKGPLLGVCGLGGSKEPNALVRLTLSSSYWRVYSSSPPSHLAVHSFVRKILPGVAKTKILSG